MSPYTISKIIAISKNRLTCNITLPCVYDVHKPTTNAKTSIQTNMIKIHINFGIVLNIIKTSDCHILPGTKTRPITAESHRTVIFRMCP